MGRKRKADAIDSANDSNKDSEITNGTSVASNDNLLSSMQTTASGQQPVTAAKTSAAIVVATPGSNLAADQKSKVNKTKICLSIRLLSDIKIFNLRLVNLFYTHKTFLG